MLNSSVLLINNIIKNLNIISSTALIIARCWCFLKINYLFYLDNVNGQLGEWLILLEKKLPSTLLFCSTFVQFSAKAN